MEFKGIYCIIPDIEQPIALHLTVVTSTSAQ
jgi:hypothetical protein